MTDPINRICFEDMPPIELPRPIQIEYDQDENPYWIVLKAVTDSWADDLAAYVTLLNILQKSCTPKKRGKGFTLDTAKLSAFEAQALDQWLHASNNAPATTDNVADIKETQPQPLSPEESLFDEQLTLEEVKIEEPVPEIVEEPIEKPVKKTRKTKTKKETKEVKEGE